MNGTEKLERYLERMERDRIADEANNKTSYQQARELSGLLSIAKHGAEPYKSKVAKIIEKNWR